MGARLVIVLVLGLWCTVLATGNDTLLLERIAITTRASAISPSKVEAALALAARLSQRCTLLTLRDSTVRRWPSTLHASLEWRSSLQGGTMSVALDRFENLLRVELTFRHAQQERRGIGYALVRHRWENSDEPLLDPALLEASQRALAIALGDSLLYGASNGSTVVFPATLAVVTNIELRDDPSLLPRWELFEDALATSYSGILAAITAAQRSPYYVTLDIDTRDSIYAQFRLYEPEPTMPPSQQELQALVYFGIEAVINGTLERTQQGALLQLRLYRIEGGKTLRLVRQIERVLSDDSRVRYLETVAALVEELLRLPLPPAQ